MAEKTMNNERLQEIRKAEKASHEDVYASTPLFQPGSWLAKPVKTVLELLPLLEGKTDLMALDLGCGIGRNCIPVAKQLQCPVVCVDILPMAIEKLEEYAEQHGVISQIKGVVSAIDAYSVQPDTYDLIMAISALEHVDSEETFLQKLQEIAAGIKPDGIVCLIVNSNVTEVDKDTGIPMDPQFEVNVPTSRMQHILECVFAGWNMVKQTIVHQRYDIPRQWGTAALETDVVTLVARKPI